MKYELKFDNRVGGLVNEDVGRGKRHFVKMRVVERCTTARYLTEHDIASNSLKYRKVLHSAERYMEAWDLHVVACGREELVEDLDTIEELTQRTLKYIANCVRNGAPPFDNDLLVDRSV